MRRLTSIAAGLAAVLWPVLCSGTDVVATERSYEGMACVSAAVAVAPDLFIASCSEDNVLRVYQTEGPGAPIASLNVSNFLQVEREPADIRGAARVADRVYWIASHSRDEQGRVRPARHRFFATTITCRQDQVCIEPVGKPCTTLLNELPGRSNVSTLRLNEALGWDEKLSESQRRRLAPADKGLYLDALCVDPRLDVLLLGFRNPRPVRVTTGRPHALMIPLNNATEVVEKGKAPRFGEATLWDFDGLGITCLVYSPVHGAYFILAQPCNGTEPCVLYRWSGMKTNPPECIRRLSLPNRDATTVKLVPFGGTDRLLLLTGGRNHDPTTAARRFQGVWIQP